MVAAHGSTTPFRDLETTDDLWIARQPARIGAYQELAEKCYEALNAGWNENVEVANKMMRTIQTCLRSVAEELGQLPQRVTVQTAPVQVTYKVEGIDPKQVV